MDTPAAASLSNLTILRRFAGLSLFCLLLSPAEVQATDWMKKFRGRGSSAEQQPASRIGKPPAPNLDVPAPGPAPPKRTAVELPLPDEERDLSLRPPAGPRFPALGLKTEASSFSTGMIDSARRLPVFAPQRRPAPHRLVNRDLNFSFGANGSWQRVYTPGKSPIEPEIMLLAPDAAVIFALHARLLSDGTQPDAGSISELFRDIEDGSLTHVWRSHPRPTAIAGCVGQIVEMTGLKSTDDGAVVSYRTSVVFAKQDVAYCLTASTTADSAHTARLAVKEHSLGFRLLSGHTDGDEADTTAVPKILDSGRDWGLVANTAGSNWVTSDFGRPIDLQGAKLAAIGRDAEVILVIPFSLLGKQPSRTALTSSLAAMIGFDLDQLRDTVSSQTVGKRQWIQLVGSKVTANLERRSVLLRLHQGDGVAYAVTASFPEEIPLREQAVRFEDFLERLSLQGDTSPTLAQLSTHDRWQHAELFNHLGNYHSRLKQHDLAVGYFRQAAELAPGSSTVVANLLATLSLLGRYEEALNLLNNPPSEIAASEFWQSERASMLAITGKTDDSVLVFERLFASGSRNDESFEAYLATLARAGRIEDAISAANRYLASGDSRSISLIKSRMLILAGEYDEAITVTKSQQSNALADPAVSYLLVEAYRDSGNYEAALQTIDALLADGGDDVKTWFLKATVEIEQKQYRAARSSLETVLQRQPDHPEVRETLELVSSLMGQSDNTEIRNAIAPVPLPENVRPATVRSAANEDASSWYGLAAVAHSFSKREDYRRTSYGVVYLEDAAAVSEFSTLQFSFKPLAERVFVNRIDVFDRDGRLLARGNIDDYYVQTDSAQELASEERVVNVPVPGLKPGCRLEYVFTSERPGYTNRFPFTQHCFSRAKPVERAVLHVAGDVSHLAVQGTVSPQSTADGLTWVVDAPPALTDEPLQIDRRKAFPSVTIAGLDGDWRELAARYMQRFSDRLNIAPNVRQLAEQISNDANARTLAGKVTAMTAFVQRELVYQGLEFGVRGQVMPPVEQTLQRRYGDCKDHSLLLYQLLRAVDVPASLCLVKSSGQVVSEIPSMEQFDHMIVFVDDGKDGWFLDATSKGSSPEFRIPAGLARHDALILNRSSSRLVQIPDYPSGASQIFADRLIQLDADGLALVTEVVQIKGYSAALYRSLIRDIDLSQRDDFIRDYLTPDKSDSKPLTGSVRNLDDHTQPLVLKATYQIKDLLHPTYGLLVGRLPQFLESGMVEYEDIEARQTPFRLSYPSDVIARTRLQLPAGYAVDGSPADISEASAFGGLASRVTVTDSEFQILSRLTRRTGEYSATQWDDYARFLSQAGETFAPRLLLREGPVQQASNETAPAAAGR